MRAEAQLPSASSGSPTPVAGRRVRIIGLAAVLGLIGYALLGLPFFVFPAQGPLPRHADVALVLGPPTRERLETAYALLRSSRVDHVILSVLPAPDDARQPDPFWRERCPALPDTLCAVADPLTTQGEARLLRSQAALHGYRSVVVISQTAHLTRARTIVGRCFSGRITMLASGEPPDGGWPYQYAYQTAATMKSWLVTNTC